MLISGSSDNNIIIWDLQTENALKTLTGHSYHVLAVVLHKNLVISGSIDGSIRLWDIETESCLDVFSDHSNAVESIDISACGNFFVSGSYDKSIKVWSREGLITTLLTDSRVKSVKLRGNTLVASLGNGTIKVWKFDK